MNNNLLQRAEQWKTKKRQKGSRKNLTGLLECFAIFFMICALLLPAAAQERQAICGQAVHVHDYECFVQLGITERVVFDCSYDALGIHLHEPSCYDEEGRVLCGQADYVIHEHECCCYDAEGYLICPLPQMNQHVHTDSCWRVENRHFHDDSCYTMEPGQLICELPEDAGHFHGADCFCPGEVFVCTMEEGHFHQEACFMEEELICRIPEGHVHDASCREQVLCCELPETEGHLHADGCYGQNQILNCLLEEYDGDAVLVCTEPDAAIHVHSSLCCHTEPVKQPLTCKLAEDEQHLHFRLCYGEWKQVCTLEEHTHTAVCYVDRTADVETESLWEETFAHVELTGDWRKDVLRIAETQLGYHESIRNYIVLEDGETIHGYTRYGDWYGDHYGDWCAMFVSFCLYYAGVDTMPLEAYCPYWVDALSDPELDLYRPAGAYEPKPGDLIFFDYERDGISDHVAFVVELLEATDEEPARYRTLEGNASNQVCYETHDLDDVRIQGFGVLPEKPHKDEPGGHIHYVSCYDESGELICQSEAGAVSDLHSKTSCKETDLQTLLAVKPYGGGSSQVPVPDHSIEQGQTAVVRTELPRITPVLALPALLLLPIALLPSKKFVKDPESDECYEFHDPTLEYTAPICTDNIKDSR